MTPRHAWSLVAAVMLANGAIAVARLCELSDTAPPLVATALPSPLPALAPVEVAAHARAQVEATLATINQALARGDLAAAIRWLDAPRLVHFLRAHHGDGHELSLAMEAAHIQIGDDLLFDLSALARSDQQIWTEPSQELRSNVTQTPATIHSEKVTELTDMQVVAVRGALQLDHVLRYVTADLHLELEGAPTRLLAFSLSNAFRQPSELTDHGLRWEAVSQDDLPCRTVQVGNRLYVEVPAPGPHVRLRLRFAGAPRLNDYTYFSSRADSTMLLSSLIPTAGRSLPSYDLLVRYRLERPGRVLSAVGAVTPSSASGPWQEARVSGVGHTKLPLLIGDLPAHHRLTYPSLGVNLYSANELNEEELAQIQDKISLALRRISLLGEVPAREIQLAFVSRSSRSPVGQLLGRDLLVLRSQRETDDVWSHELAHLWFGTLISDFSPYAGHWWEAVAEYVCTWDLDPDAAEEARRTRLFDYADLEEFDDLPLTSRQHGSWRSEHALSYGKGMLVMQALEVKLGRPRVAAFLRALAARNHHQFTDWPDLAALLRTLEGDEIAGWFEDWMSRPGAPALELSGSVTAVEGEQTFTGALAQNLPEGVAPYRGVVEVAMRADDGTTLARHRVELAGERTALALPVPALTRKVVLDPDVRFPRHLRVRGEGRDPRLVETEVALPPR
ncbi:MAG: hypothetical protein IPI49_14485 [Myxococcales bacterium]|nr:hypothetical protein [Myxococcales bacterium]